MLTDQEFIKQLESKTLDTKYFRHMGHLRLSWICLNQYEFDKACSLVDSSVSAYAKHLGVPEKYNATVTYTLMKIIEKRIKKQNSKTFEEFLENNCDIVDDAVSVMCEYFTKARLFSDEARKTLIQPDLKQL